MLSLSAVRRLLLVLGILFIGSLVVAAPFHEVERPLQQLEPILTPTPAPRAPLSANLTPDEAYAFYRRPDVVSQPQRESQANRRKDIFAKRQESLSVSVASLGPPQFPNSIPSCPKCEAQYSSLLSCMSATSVFANATSIFNNPIAYIDVIRCSCTDTFQAVFPQCVDCFQNTNQCAYLGTDPQGTGAGNLVTNIRSICGLGSALLGGVATANTNVGSTTPTDPGSYSDVTSTGAGYINEATGALFPSNAVRVRISFYGVAIFFCTALSVTVGGARLFL